MEGIEDRYDVMRRHPSQNELIEMFSCSSFPSEIHAKYERRVCIPI